MTISHVSSVRLWHPKGDRSMSQYHCYKHHCWQKSRALLFKLPSLFFEIPTKPGGNRKSPSCFEIQSIWLPHVTYKNNICIYDHNSLSLSLSIYIYVKFYVHSWCLQATCNCGGPPLHLCWLLLIQHHPDLHCLELLYIYEFKSLCFSWHGFKWCIYIHNYIYIYINIYIYT